MLNDDLEFSITQYLDGSLDETKRIALEAQLAADPEARALLAEHRALGDLLQSIPLPQVRWEKLSHHISAAIDDQESAPLTHASWWIWARMPQVAAIAASVLLVTGLAMHFLLGPQPPSSRPVIPGPNLIASISVDGPSEDAPDGLPVTEVSIGPGGSYAKASSLAPYADQIEVRPARVVIAAGIPQEQPPSAFPF